MACDEKVISDMEMPDKKAYANALVSCSMQRRLVLAYPLAFGEVGVKERAKGVLNYKKPAFWIIVVAMIACIVIAVCFLTNPAQKSFDIRITIPAGSVEGYYYSDEEISPKRNTVTLRPKSGIGDASVILLPTSVSAVEGDDASEEAYMTPGMTVRLNARDDWWYKIGVRASNPTDEDMIVYVEARNVEVRIASGANSDLEKYRTQYIGDAPKVSAIAQRLPHPEGYVWTSIRY